jgi:hypothetical protein
MERICSLQFLWQNHSCISKTNPEIHAVYYWLRMSAGNPKYVIPLVFLFHQHVLIHCCCPGSVRRTRTALIRTYSCLLETDPGTALEWGLLSWTWSRSRQSPTELHLQTLQGNTGQYNFWTNTILWKFFLTEESTYRKVCAHSSFNTLSYRPKNLSLSCLLDFKFIWFWSHIFCFKRTKNRKIIHSYANKHDTIVFSVFELEQSLSSA